MSLAAPQLRSAPPAQTAIACALMRGGTSKGPFFEARDLPPETALRDRVLLAALGSPDVRQIDGVGAADSLTSKVAIVGPATRPDADVDYLFAQVVVNEARVDTAQNCGNMLAGVGPFAIERGPGCKRFVKRSLSRSSRGRLELRPARRSATTRFAPASRARSSSWHASVAPI